MALLVTGAMGHVGYAVARLAARRGVAVMAQYRERFRPSDAAAAGAGVTWVRCDLADPAAVRALVASGGVDRCIHAAAVSNEAFAKPAPLAAVAANIGATANLLEAARLGGWRRFVLVGTGSVFQAIADPSLPILEDEPPSARNVYATTKLGAESLTRLYRAEFGLSAATVRVSWVYGPPVAAEDPTRGPIPSFLLRALRGVAIRESGADFAASFTYVDDVAEGLLVAAGVPELRWDTYHLGPGVNFSARRVAEAVRRAVPGAVIELTPGTEPWTRHTSLRGPLAGDRFAADTGYAVRHSLDAGIGTYAAWLRDNRSAWSE
jgi:nucleoside-diphosphate-sugar epimerase